MHSRAQGLTGALGLYLPMKVLVQLDCFLQFGSKTCRLGRSAVLQALSSLVSSLCAVLSYSSQPICPISGRRLCNAVVAASRGEQIAGGACA